MHNKTFLCMTGGTLTVLVAEDVVGGTKAKVVAELPSVSDG